MLPDLGRLLTLLYATAAAAVALRFVLGRWRPALTALAAAGGLALVARRLLRRPRPVAPDGWPSAGRATLALATGDGVWRVDLASGRAYPASSTGEPTVDVRVEAGRLRATSALAERATGDWRTWTLSWPRPGAVAWRRPRPPPAAAAAGLPRRGERVLAARPDGAGGNHLGTGPWWAGPAVRAFLTAPSGRIGGLARALLARRRGRLYHLDGGGTRRLIAADLPPVFGIAPVPVEGELAGPPAPVRIRPIPAGPAPTEVAAAAGGR